MRTDWDKKCYAVRLRSNSEVIRNKRKDHPIEYYEGAILKSRVGPVRDGDRFPFTLGLSIPPNNWRWATDFEIECYEHNGIKNINEINQHV